jgi:predicted DCC family thiol-disulfide oxidoreductase YuxK
MDRRFFVRRLLNDIASYFAELASEFQRGWLRFFFTPADPTPVGLIRVGTGLLAFWSLLVFGLDLQDFFGSRGWAEPAAIRALEGPLTWSFWFLVGDPWLPAVWVLCLVVLGLFTVGLWSRLTSVLGWVIVVSTVRRVPIALFGFDQILSVLMLYLAATGAGGQAVSLDRFLRRWRQARALSTGGRGLERAGRPAGRVRPDQSGVPAATVSANLTLRLIQLHLVVIYGMAGLAKLQGPSWWNGTSLWKTMTTGEFVVLDLTALAAWPLLINLLTHVSLALELLYPVLIWVRILRPMLLAGMAALHLGICVMSPGLTEFALAMLVANLAFVSGGWLRARVAERGAPAVRVVFDGGCPRCRATLALITAADPDRVVEPIDLTATDLRSVHAGLTREDCMRSMHVVSSSGRVTAGFDGARAIAARLPLFWPLAVIGFLPGVAWLGRRVYNRLAATRPRDVPCTDLMCGIHSRQPPLAHRDRGHSQSHYKTIATLADTEEAPHS